MNVPGSRSLLRLTARLMLAVLLFAQFALTAQACVGPRDMGSALRHDHPVAASEAEPPCHQHGMTADSGAATDDGMSANLCVAHCTWGDQSSDTHQVTVHAIPSLAVLSVSLAAPSEALPARALEIPHQAAPPPVPILFGIFRS